MNRQRYDSTVAMPTLVDYWLGDLDAADEARMEYTLMGCIDDVQWVADHAAGIRMLVERGAMRAVVSETFLARAAARGLKVREYVAPYRGGTIACTVAPDDDLLVVRLEAPLAGVRQLDLLMLDNHGGGLERARAIPFETASGSVLLASRAVDVRGRPTTTCCMQLLAVNGNGERRVGDYALHYRPWRGR